MSSIFLLAITGSLNLYWVGKEDAISFLNLRVHVKLPHIKTIQTTETDIKCIIYSHDTKN
jgi:hypothetical protein